MNYADSYADCCPADPRWDEGDIEIVWDEARASILADEEATCKKYGCWDESDRAGFEIEYAPSDSEIETRAIEILEHNAEQSRREQYE